jgi:hypothetical protein
MDAVGKTETRTVVRPTVWTSDVQFTEDAMPYRYTHRRFLCGRHLLKEVRRPWSSLFALLRIVETGTAVVGCFAQYQISSNNLCSSSKSDFIAGLSKFSSLESCL